MERQCNVSMPKFDGFCQRHKNPNPNYSSATNTVVLSSTDPTTNVNESSCKLKIPTAVEESDVSQSSFNSRVFDDMTQSQLASNLKELALKGDLSRPQCYMLKKAMENGPYSTPSNTQSVESSFKSEKTLKNTHQNIVSSSSSSMHAYKENIVEKGYKQLKGKKRVTKEKLSCTQRSIKETSLENISLAKAQVNQDKEERKRKRREDRGKCLDKLEKDRQQKEKRLRVRSVNIIIDKSQSIDELHRVICRNFCTRSLLKQSKSGTVILCL